MTNKIKLSIGIDYDKEEYGSDGGYQEVTINKDMNDDPTWTDLMKLFINALEGHGYVLSEDTKFVLENVNGQNSAEIANLVDKVID